MMSLSADKDAEIIEGFISTSSYMDDLLDVGNTYFDSMVEQIYPSELNETNSSNTEAPFLGLHLTISDGFVSSKIYDKSNDFDFDIVYGVCVCELGLTLLSTIFQSYHDGVWLRQGAQCSLL